MDRSERPEDTTGDRSIAELLTRLASELRATEERPVDAATSVRLGEAHAVAEDLARAEDDLDRSVVHERVGHVRRLLADVSDPDDEAVAERIEDALALTGTIRERTRDDGRDR
jgi:hypothetical protein